MKIMNLFLLIISVLLLLNCADPENGYVEGKLSWAFWIYLLQELENQKNQVTYTYEVEDQNNGSVKSIATSSKGEVKTYYYKKCLQGQVYREAENDCRGTGSESDIYGAVELQYCDRANNSCNGGRYNHDGILDGGGNSEAYNSCDSDTTLGRTWKVAEFHDGIFDEVNASTIYSDMSNKDISVWTSKSDSEIYAELSKVPLNRNWNWSSKKNNGKYVLCVSEG